MSSSDDRPAARLIGRFVRSGRVSCIAVLVAAACLPSTSGPTTPATSTEPSHGAPRTSPSASVSLPTPLGSTSALPAYPLVVTRGPRGGEQQIEIVSPRTSATSPVARGADPAWSTDGRSIVFACPGAAGWVPSICITAADDPSEGARPLVKDGDRPAPGPDGHAIAFHRGTVDVGDTWRVNRDGSGLTRLASGAFLSWSPDGNWLLGQPESAGFQLAVIGKEGGEARVLGTGYGPAWSPDGERIAYAVAGGRSSSLSVLSLATGSVETRNTATAELGGVAWLAGDAIAFVENGDVWRVDPGSTEPVRLTAGLEIPSGSLASPLAVSADGEWIAFANGPSDRSDLAIASAQGGWVLLDLGREAVTQPAWRP